MFQNYLNFLNDENYEKMCLPYMDIFKIKNIQILYHHDFHEFQLF